MTSSHTLLIDLRATQVNGDRGIPAYTQSLSAELIRRAPGHRWILLHDSRWPLPTQAGELATRADWRTAEQLERDRSLRIDGVLTGCFFLPDHRCGADSLWPAWLARHRPRRTGIVYDLVPLLFPDRYLHRHRARRHYLDSLRVLRQSDHLYAISHATRRDTIRHAAIDPARITCIYGDIDHRKRQLMQLPAAATSNLPPRYGLHGPYCVCVGGDDWRKNMATTVRAFAIFRASHPDHQLAIVCKLSAERIAELQQLATTLGIPTDAVVCTGFIPDQDLVGLVRHASLLVYPSLYEGLGLPVLEAYGCGTPAVGSNSSSVAELILPDLTCDPEDPVAIAAVMHRVTTDEHLRSRALRFGHRLLAEELGWERAADLVLDHLTGQGAPAAPSGRGTAAAPRVAVVGALPPARTGIAPLTLRFLQSDHWQTTFYEANHAARLPQQANLLASTRVLPVETLSAALLRGRHDTTIFVLGNSPHHGKVLDAVFRTRGLRTRRLAYLHEAALEALLRARLGAEAERLPNAPVSPGETANDGSCRPGAVPDWITRALTAKPELGRGLRFLADHAALDGLIVNSEACRDLVQTVLGSRADRWTIDVVFLPIVMEDCSTSRPPAGPGPLRIGTFGLAGDTKQLDLLVAATQILGRNRKVELVIAGWEARRFCRRTGLDRLPGVEVQDSPDEPSLAAAMRGVHVAVQLRSPTFGESSGIVSQLLAVGTPMVVTAAGSFAELPTELASFVPATCSAEALAAAIEAAALTERSGPERAALLASRSPAAFATSLATILAAQPRPVPVPLSA
jgi:glycosyltransferase involved in cell wall biosynthesis